SSRLPGFWPPDVGTSRGANLLRTSADCNRLAKFRGLLLRPFSYRASIAPIADFRPLNWCYRAHNSGNLEFSRHRSRSVRTWPGVEFHLTRLTRCGGCHEVDACTGGAGGQPVACG